MGIAHTESFIHVYLGFCDSGEALAGKSQATYKLSKEKKIFDPDHWGYSQLVFDADHQYVKPNETRAQIKEMLYPL